MTPMDIEAVTQAAEWIADADALLITAGAGMSADPPLPDLRGAGRYWRTHPWLEQSGVEFGEIASPSTFRSDPRLAWGFYGRRLNLYRRTVPHEGYEILRRWADDKAYGAFVFTSNVDGQFQKAGFADDRVCEAHGSIHHLQCLDACGDHIWAGDGFEPVVDEGQCRLVSALPGCRHCSSVARPNVMMFSDYEWLSGRAETRLAKLGKWASLVPRLVVIEIGAGTSIPTVRRFTEGFGARYVRINTTEPESPGRGIGLRGGGLQMLRLISNIIDRSGGSGGDRDRSAHDRTPVAV
ncbi:MAG: SIR2 family NAD-dependent protein deacylase [Gemmatimonadota bacterium]